MLKILVLHPDNEHLDTIITKVNTLNDKSGPFNSVIFLGDVFNNDGSIVNNKLNSTNGYFTEGLTKLSKDFDTDGIKERNNINFLGKFGIFTTYEGLNIAYITGDDQFIDENYESIGLKFQKFDQDIDIFITSKWSKIISQEEKLFFGNSKLDSIIKLIKPKYHFAIGSKVGKFFERSPFQWEGTDKITRFISLAKYGTNEKWIYAFNLNKDQIILDNLPQNLSSNPFEKLNNLDDDNSNKRKIINHNKENFEVDNIYNKKPKREVLPEDCFFCLSNPKLQSHMIISIGEHAYLATARGPLTKPNDKFKFSGHCLIIPIAHIPTLPKSNNNEENSTVINTALYNEILRFQLSIVKLFAQFNYATIFFQINKSNNIHYHIQTFPIPLDFLIDFEKNLNKNKDLNNNKNNSTKLNFQKFSNIENEDYIKILNGDKDYISFIIFEKSINKQSIYISILEDFKSLDLQFGRRVLAYLLQTPKRLKWDKCQQSQERETKETEFFKESFKPFDFTLDL